MQILQLNYSAFSLREKSKENVMHQYHFYRTSILFNKVGWYHVVVLMLISDTHVGIDPLPLEHFTLH